MDVTQTNLATIMMIWTTRASGNNFGRGQRKTLPWDIFWILWIIVTLVSSVASYTLQAPRVYNLLEDDIIVIFKVPSKGPGLRVQLLQVVNGVETPIVKKDVPRGNTYGKLVFPCGLLSQAASIYFRMETVLEGEILAKSNPVDVRWPTAKVHVPLLVETYTNVMVQVELSPLTCTPRDPVDYKVSLEVIFLGTTLPAPGEVSSWLHKVVVYEYSVPDWLMKNVTDVLLPCNVFHRAGYYMVGFKAKIRLRTSQDELLAESDEINVLWSRRYDLNIPQLSVTPCLDGVDVIYEYPRCIGEHDRVRVYGRPSDKKLKLVKNQQPEMKYLFETRVQKGRHKVNLDCDTFSEEYDEFCFTYYSTAASGAVFEIKTICRPRSFDPGGIEAEWGDWSSWTSCSATCGSGVQSRYRLCTAPNEAIDLVSCPGTPVDSRLCVENPCTETPVITTTDEPGQLVTCPCGCTTYLRMDGSLFVNPTRTCRSPSVWVLQVHSGDNILIRILEARLESRGKLWLTIRDGSSSAGTLLAIVTGDTSLPSNVVKSRGSVLRLELHSKNVSQKELPFFKATFNIESKSPQSYYVLEPTEETPWIASFDAVHMVIAFLGCLVVLCIVVFFIVYKTRRFFQKKPIESIPSESVCSLNHQDDEIFACPRTHLICGSDNTSVSEVSASPLSQRRRRLSPVEEGTSPEDYLQNAFLFKSFSSICTASPPQTPRARTPVLPRKKFFSPTTGRKLLVATVSPVPQKRSNGHHKVIKPSILNAKTKELGTSKEDSVGSLSPVRMRRRMSESKSKNVRESATPLTESCSQLSINASEDGLQSEDGFEFDYYDYGMTSDPNSFFCADPSLLGWPPFIPIPPSFDDEDIFPMQHFTPSPPVSSNADTEIGSNKDSNMS